MARRTLIDIDGKMLRATVKIGGNEGIEQITSRKIAGLCDITDPLIFVHFGTMDNLILKAYSMVLLAFHEKAEEAAFTGKIDDLQNKFKNVINYLVSVPENTQFVYNMMHSKYGKEFPKDLVPYYIGFMKKLLNHKKDEYSYEEYIGIFFGMIESVFGLACKFIRNQLVCDDKMLSRMFTIIFAGYKEIRK